MKSLPRLLLISYAPGGPSGFGNQAAILYEAATAAGWEVAVAQLCECPRETPPRVVHADGMVVTWLVQTQIPAESLGFILDEYRPDAILALCELWQLAGLFLFPHWLERTHVWLAPDCEVIPDGAEQALELFRTVVVTSEFAERAWGPQLRRPIVRIPHGIDGDFFRVLPAAHVASIREATGTTGCFVAAHVGKNCLRKQQPLLIDGWGRFLAELPAAERSGCFLCLHTAPAPTPQPDPFGNGVDLPRFISQYPEDVQRSIRWSAPGGPEGLVALYNMADVHVLTSMGEGFGIPLVEAQACGTPNIAADNTTTPEILGIDGWRVPCNSFLVQPDLCIKRPLVDANAIAAALRNSWAGSPPTRHRRQELHGRVLARYDRRDVKAKWTALLEGAQP